MSIQVAQDGPQHPSGDAEHPPLRRPRLGGFKP
jgi:hypothetical protein